MESTLLSASRFIPAQNREVGGLVRNFQSSFYGKVICNKKFLRIHGYTPRRGHATVTTSVIGKKVKKDTIIPDPDYRIPIVLLGLAGGLGYTNNLLPAAPVGLLGLLLLFQEVKVGDQLEELGKNVFVGGKNRWKMGSNCMMLWWNELALQKLVGRFSPESLSSVFTIIDHAI